MPYLKQTLVVLFAIFTLFFICETPVQLHANPSIRITKQDSKQIECLTRNMYHEAANQSYKGWLAVGFVTINRTKSDVFPDTICEVVYQKDQFSWVKTKRHITKFNETLYNEIKYVATHLYFNHEDMKDITYGAMFFHAVYVRPNWRGLRMTARIGEHIFYRNPKLEMRTT